jgi:hypothetical protein
MITSSSIFPDPGLPTQSVNVPPRLNGCQHHSFRSLMQLPQGCKDVLRRKHFRVDFHMDNICMRVTQKLTRVVQLQKLSENGAHGLTSIAMRIPRCWV